MPWKHHRFRVARLAFSRSRNTYRGKVAESKKLEHILMFQPWLPELMKELFLFLELRA
jgi:hypothetical protein